MISGLRRGLARVRALFGKAAMDSEMNDELAGHVEFATADNARRGMSPDEARRAALVALGGMEQARELHRDTRGLPLVEDLLQDLRIAVRALARERGFASVAILILALGIGANIAVFSVVNTLLLRPLPFRDAGRLAWFASNHGLGGLSDQTYTVSAFEEFRRHNTAFEDVTSYQTFFNSLSYKMTGRREPLPLVGIEVAENFFPLLGVRPALGRNFSAVECQKGGPSAVILGNAFWRRQFMADPAIIGQSVSINGAPVTVVGVLPSSYDFGSVFSPGMNVDIYMPAVMDFWRTWGNTLAIVGRLKPGMTVEQAQAEAKVLFPHLRSLHSDWWEDYDTVVSTLANHVSGQLRRSLIALWFAVGVIMAIVCVNLSNLLLARTAVRAKEFALRGALGAGKGRLVRQMLTESLLLAALGAAFGLCIAYGVTGYLAHQGSIALPMLNSVRVDAAALAWTLIITLLVGILFGLAPALRVSGVNLQEALKDSGAGLSRGRRHEVVRKGLVVSQIALACMLLFGAGLLLRSFLKVLDVDLGFRPERTAALKIDLTDNGDHAKRNPELRAILDKVTVVPGVESAAICDMLPLDRNRSWGMQVKGSIEKNGRYLNPFVYVVSPGYLGTMGMRLTSGRDLSWRAGPGAENEIVINEAAAREGWKGKDAVGRLVSGLAEKESRVVGVIADVHEISPETPSSPEVYLPMAQSDPEGAELVIKTRLPIEAVAPSVMAAVRSLNPDQPATQFRQIGEIVEHSVSPRRFFAELVSVLAVFGLVLASLGIYGVVSYTVAQRTQDIGIRMALGASPSRVISEVVGSSLGTTFVGISVGTALSLVMGRLMASLLFATPAMDPVTFATTICVLGLVALAAAFLPARQASRINPIIAIRGK